MSANCINFEPQFGVFAFDGQRQYTGEVTFRKGVACVSTDESGKGVAFSHGVIGLIIGEALRGSEYVQFDRCCVSVNYLLQMLRHTTKTGGFWDCLDNTPDHRFDNNTPTPGGYVGEIRQLGAQIKELQRYANGARMAYMTSEVEQTEETISQLRAQIRTLSAN